MYFYVNGKGTCRDRGIAYFDDGEGVPDFPKTDLNVRQPQLMTKNRSSGHSYPKLALKRYSYPKFSPKTPVFDTKKPKFSMNK